MKYTKMFLTCFLATGLAIFSIVGISIVSHKEVFIRKEVMKEYNSMIIQKYLDSINISKK